MKSLLKIFLGMLFFFLGACGTPASSEAVVDEPTQALPAALPTEMPTVLPTETALPTLAPTPLPEGTIFRDDFVGSLLPGWTWENENAARWTVTGDGWLQIIADDPSLLAGQPQVNTLWLDLPDGDFVISVHVQTQPTANFQQAAIFLFEDVDNYVAINRGYCAPCFSGQDGNGIFMDYKLNGESGAYKQHVEESDVYLRLVFEDNIISAYYALAPDAWERLGRFGNYFKFARVGLGAANIDFEGRNEDLVALYDYFEVTRP